MSEKTYKKIIVFDVNLDWNSYKKEDRRYKDLLLIYPLMQQAMENQIVVIQTNGWLLDAINFANTHNITKGYLSVNGGAIIYDIASKKIIVSLTLNTNDIKAAVHHGIMNSVNVSIYTPDRKFIYISNDVSYQLIKSICYSQYDVIDSYDMLQKIMSRNDIVNIGYYLLLGSVDNQHQRMLMYNFDKFWEDEISNINIKVNKTSNYINIGCKEASKLKAIEKIMFLNEITHLSDILYIAASCIDDECYVSFKNSLITSNYDFINEIGNQKQHHYLAKEIDKLDPEFGLKTNSFWK